MKKFSLIMLLLILVTSVVAVFLSVQEVVRKNQINTVSELGLQSIVEKTQEKCTAALKNKSLLPLLIDSEKEIENVSLNTETKTESSSIILYDVYEKPQFICTEFLEGGYAITRISTQGIYERTELGVSPYNLNWDKKCYYFGTQNYYYRIGSEIFNINNEEKISQEILKTLQSSLEATYKREELFYAESTNNSLESCAVENTADYGRSHIKTIGSNSTGWLRASKSIYFSLLSYNVVNDFYYKTSNQPTTTDLLFPIMGLHVHKLQ